MTGELIAIIVAALIFAVIAFFVNDFLLRNRVIPLPEPTFAPQRGPQG